MAAVLWCYTQYCREKFQKLYRKTVMAGPYFIKVVYLAHKKGFWYGWVSQKSTNAIWPAIFQKNSRYLLLPDSPNTNTKEGWPRRSYSIMVTDLLSNHSRVQQKYYIAFLLNFWRLSASDFYVSLLHHLFKILCCWPKFLYNLNYIQWEEICRNFENVEKKVILICYFFISA